MSIISSKRSHLYKFYKTTFSDLNMDILPLIFHKLSFMDLFQCKQVCSSWYSCLKFVKAHPCLMLPNQDDNHYDDVNDNTNHYHHQRFFSLSYKRGSEEFYKFEDEIFDQHENLFLGSSNGWLVVLNKPKKGSFILNPFTKKKLHIPNVGTSLTCTIISKAIVVSSKKKQGNDNDNNTNWVVVIYGYVQQKLACCKVGGDDDCSWNDLKDTAYPNMSFCDILSHKNHLFGLSNSNHVHIWDFSHNGSNVPTKLIPLVPKSQPCFDLLKSEKFKKESYFCQSYLVESMSGELLLVTRVVGYIVNSDGELLEEADLYDGLICPYSTVAICVHKMKMKMKRETEKLEFEWENVESLGCDEAVFVGRSESMCCSTEFVPGYKGNSIYFSDDNWDMMDIDYSFGGHDNGVYSMETKTVVKVEPWFDQIQAEKIYPPPLWILPKLV